MEDKHWAQVLFPPTFQLSKDEVKNPSSGGTTLLHDNSPRTRVEAIYRRVKSEFDEDVWNARQKSTQVGDSLLERPEIKDNQHGEDTDETSRDKDFSFVGFNDKDGNSDNSKLWDSSEIEVLRKVFMKTKHENSNLKVELDVVKNDIQRITEKLKEREKNSEVKDDMAKVTRNAFENLYLENTHLQREVKFTKRRCKSLEDDVKDLCKAKEKLKSDMREERGKYLKEQAQRRHLEAGLRNLELRHKTSERAAVETLKMDYEMKIKRLLDELREKSGSLEKEREDHVHTKKALDHMRYHFASLPHEPLNIASRSDDDILSNLQIY